jgi:type I restriction enzyme M protein
MLMGELRNQIDGIWNDFWSGGLANPLQVIEQITYLIFIKRLDEMQELEERKANTLGKTIERTIFPAGKDESGEPYTNLRWSRFKHFAGPEMFRIIDEHVFPFIRALNGKGTSYARHMRDARFQIPGRRCSPRSSTSSTSSTWATEIPRATCTSTCSRRSPQPARTASSVLLATSSR